MSRLSLKESRAIADLAQFLYDFLPGSGSPKWEGHVSFKTVAAKIGVANFWQPGSKLPMITTLLERTLEYRRDHFEHLILEIVRTGITYREKQGNPLTPEDIDRLNGLILELVHRDINSYYSSFPKKRESRAFNGFPIKLGMTRNFCHNVLGFKFPELWDPDFRNSLRLEGGDRAKELVEQAIKKEKIKESAQTKNSQQILELKDQYFSLCSQANRQKAGLSLENVLNRLFDLHGLAPREPFRVVGEQIDGSFELDHETYLVEAKWERDPLPEADLLTFRGKIEGKSAYTRGVFISISGISKEASLAIVKGKQPTFFVMDGYDLTMVLSEAIGLVEFLRQRQRILAEEGLVVVPFAELETRTRKRD